MCHEVRPDATSVPSHPTPLTALNRRQTGHIINLKKVTRAVDFDSMDRLLKHTVFGFIVKF